MKRIKLHLLNKRLHRLFDTKITVSNVFPLDKIKSIGHNSYGPIMVRSWGNDNESLTIGSWVSIADNVTFFLGGNHEYHSLLMYPFQIDKNDILQDLNKSPYSNGAIIVGDDVWIGSNVTVLPF